MRNDLTPIERTKKEMKMLTWTLSAIIVLVVAVVVFSISYL